MGSKYCRVWTCRSNFAEINKTDDIFRNGNKSDMEELIR